MEVSEILQGSKTKEEIGKISDVNATGLVSGSRVAAVCIVISACVRKDLAYGLPLKNKQRSCLYTGRRRRN